jgi:hypothetical protein
MGTEFSPTPRVLQRVLKTRRGSIEELDQNIEYSIKKSNIHRKQVRLATPIQAGARERRQPLELYTYNRLLASEGERGARARGEARARGDGAETDNIEALASFGRFTMGFA